MACIGVRASGTRGLGAFHSVEFLGVHVEPSSGTRGAQVPGVQPGSDLGDGLAAGGDRESEEQHFDVVRKPPHSVESVHDRRPRLLLLLWFSCGGVTHAHG
jgi:hypothetical protein